jgi:hypothetical protein
MSAAALPAQFGDVDLDDLDLRGDDEIESFDSALAEMPRSAPPRPRSTPPEGRRNLKPHSER